MPRPTTALAMIFVLAALAAPAAHADWIHTTDSYFEAETNNQPHPTSVVRRILTPTDVEEGVSVCVIYENSMAQRSRGKVRTRITIERGGAILETLVINGRVRRNSFDRCKLTEALLAGDLVTFEFSFVNMPRMQKTSTRTDFATIAGAVVAPGVELPEGPAPGPLSVQDQEALVALRAWIGTGRGIAVRFETNGVHIDYRLGAGQGGGAIGPFRTIAAAATAFFNLL